MSLPENIKSSFCALPFNSVSVAPFGSIRVCCNNYQMPTDASGKQIGFQNGKLELREALNNQFHRELRLGMLRGERHPSCHRCWDIEDHGGQSYRQSWNQSYAQNFSDYLENTEADGSIRSVQANYVEITLGNKCNLRCRMCNPHSSSQWIQEAEATGLMSKERLEPLRKLDWFKTPEFAATLDSLLLRSDRLNFLGGEPLLNKEHVQILEKCIELGRSKDIIVQYNSNVTVLPEEVLRAWKHFKQVYLNISVDAYGAHNEYIRYPSRWSEVTENIARLAAFKREAPLDLSIHCTFQALNVNRLHKLYEWVFHELGPMGVCRIPWVIYVNHPKHLDPRILPEEMKRAAYESQKRFLNSVDVTKLDAREEAWLRMMNSHVENLLNPLPREERESLWKEFERHTHLSDGYRNQNVLQHVPELAAHLGA